MTGKAVAKAASKSSAATSKKASKDDDAYVQKGAKKAVANDENKVKRPTSAYFYYCNDRRESLKKDEPGLSMTDSTKKMSEEWKNLDAKKKKKFEDLAAKDKERYEREKAEAPATTKGGKALKKAREDLGGLKRPLSAYFLYQEERRELIKKEKPGL